MITLIYLLMNNFYPCALYAIHIDVRRLKKQGQKVVHKNVS